MKFINPASPYRKSLESCVKEGVLAEIVIKSFDYYLIPFALFLGATPQQIGALVAIPNLVSSLSLVLAPYILRLVKSRRRVILASVIIQTIVLLPMGFLSLVTQPLNITLIIILISIFRALGTIMGPSWGSLVSHYLEDGQRGTYFGGRNRIIGITGVIGSIFWATLLSLTSHIEQLGYLILFLSVFFFRGISVFFAAKMQERELDRRPGELPAPRFSVIQFIRSLRKENFAKFVAYVAATTFSAQMALPYLSVWMRQYMELNYGWYTAVHLSSVVAGLICYPLWGRHADAVGSAKIMKRTSLLIVPIPILWCFAFHPALLMAAELYSGFVWSGFNLSVTNYVYDSSSPERRVNNLVYFNLMNGIAASLGAASGGFLMMHLPPFLGYSILTLFVLSAVLRYITHFIISSHFTEVRSVRKISGRELILSVLGIRPIIGKDTLWKNSV